MAAWLRHHALTHHHHPRRLYWSHAAHPVPILDDLIKSFFYKNLVRSLAAAYHLSLSPGEVAALGEERGQGCMNGCLIGVVEYLAKRLARKVIFVLEWRRAIDLVTHAYYVRHLTDYAFQQGWYIPGDPNQALQLLKNSVKPA